MRCAWPSRTTGPGLPDTFDSEAKVEHLFEKFARGVDESSTTGVGLGLAICRAIVEAHGGTIGIEAAKTLALKPPARGFRVVVMLPRREAPAVDETNDSRGDAGARATA